MVKLDDNQQKFLGKLEEIDKVFDEIFSKDANGMVIPFGSERNELERFRQRSKKILNKLRTHEFTVAVVGLEKAGKSTLGNALLKRNILPEYTTRCTYTTTKIMAGDKDHGKIFFYNAEKFKSNFADTLKKILQYPNQADFDTMDVTSFKRWWETMADKNPDLYRAQNKSTAADVVLMLEERKTIRGLLGNAPMDFYDDDLESINFKQFITGIVGVKSDGSTIRSGHPYAVEKVIIESANLGLEDIVLYDVPGFNSPTELHEKQTLEMLREADAIILVTNVGVTPNLDKSQLGILRSGRDEENIPLSDKAFVFGNQIDRATNLEVAKRNAAELKSDALDNAIAKDNHIFFGAAKAYLESLGIESSDAALKGSTASRDKMDEWGMTYGIAELWASMTDYYNNDRFKVLARRAENTVADAEKFLDSILKKYESAQWQPIETGGEFYLEAIHNLNTFREAAYDIAEKNNRRIDEEMPFSRMIQERIEEFYPNQTTESELLKKIKQSGNVFANSQAAITRIDSTFREELEREFLRNIVTATAEATEKEEQNIYQEIIEKFLEIMGMPTDSPYKDELTDSVRDMFNKLWIKNADKCRFNSLVERFTSGLLEVLIMTPFSSAERLQRVTGEKSFNEFLSLATYYENSRAAKSNDDDRYIDFFAKIFLHDNIAESETVKTALENFLKENRDVVFAGLSVAVNLLPLGRWAKLLLRAGVKANDLPADLKSKLQGVFYRGDWQNLSKDERIQRFENTIDSYSKTKSDFSGRLTPEKLAKMHEHSRHMEITNEDEMLNVLNEDIEILRKFTLEAIIYAIGLEQAFISVMTKNINIIRRDKDTPEGMKIFDAWIMQNIRKIRENEFRGLDQRNLENQTRKNIVETIRSYVNRLGDLNRRTVV